MVARSELLEALSEAKANKEEALAKAKDLAWMEGQLSKAQEQVSLRAPSQLRSSRACMPFPRLVFPRFMLDAIASA